MPSDFNNQIIGLVRFSFPALSGFGKGGQDIAEREAFLFDPARLERRFYLFEKLCLPSLLAQTDPDFTILFLIGERMPPTAVARLARLIAPLKDARIIQRQSGHNYGAVCKAFDEVGAVGFTHRTSFRLDDDDALSCSYIERLKRTARDLKPMCRPERPVAIAFNRGFYVEVQEGENTVIDANERTPVSVGSALFAEVSEPQNIYARNHRFLGQFFNLYSDVGAPNFIRTIHADNDSKPSIVGLSNMMSPQTIAEEIAASFPFDLAELKSL
ncbi:glycosyltransferase [Halocynthiibacter sp. C4]|uniref:glycosyltransferase n=1 Tax=Halocynthiibacter sp. C4 TaxID=2992758 RepID=UPI00237C2742|nr:glycosyltransferase [Halocynthiibacter sp. C4]MDE0588438.1 glycosyltransferase [Halocynthiibacter sp. C4]